MRDVGTQIALLAPSAVTGFTRTSSTVHIYSGGAEPGRALCGAKLTAATTLGADCTRCLEKAERYIADHMRELVGDER